MTVLKTIFIENKKDLLSKILNLERIDNVFKLVYELFLYSVLGFFAKIITKLFKL